MGRGANQKNITTQIDTRNDTILNPWDDQEILQRLINEGLSQAKMAERLGCSAGIIARRLNNFDLETIHPKTNYSGKEKPWNDKQLLNKLIKCNYTIKTIAQYLGCGETTIRYYFKKFGLKTVNGNSVRENIKYGINVFQLPIFNPLYSPETIMNTCEQHGHTVYRLQGRRNRNKYNYICSKCISQSSAEHVKDKRLKIKQQIVEKMGGQCLRCGYNKNISALHCHHIDRMSKEFSITAAINGRPYKSKEKILAEVEKCELLCSNCHQKEHSSLISNGNYRDSYHKNMHVKKLSLICVLGNKCSLCHNEDKFILQFHHLKPQEKHFNLSSNESANIDQELIWKEAEKCILLCANCHAEVESGMHDDKQAQWLNDIPHTNCSFEEWSSSLVQYSFTKPARIYKCSCGREISQGAERCLVCYHKSQRKVKDRPSKKKLLEDLKDNSYLAVGRKYGVSDNTIRKWLKSNNISLNTS